MLNILIFLKQYRMWNHEAFSGCHLYPTSAETILFSDLCVSDLNIVFIELSVFGEKCQFFNLKILNFQIFDSAPQSVLKIWSAAKTCCYRILILKINWISFFCRKLRHTYCTACLLHLCILHVKRGATQLDKVGRKVPVSFFWIRDNKLRLSTHFVA